MTLVDSRFVSLAGRMVKITHETEDRVEAFFIWNNEMKDESAELHTGGTFVVTKRTATLPLEYDRRHDNVRTCVYFRYHKVDIFKIIVDGTKIHDEESDQREVETYIYDSQPGTPDYLDCQDISDGFRDFLKRMIESRGTPTHFSARAPFIPIWSTPATTRQAQPDG